ncbi:hypothetical protein ABK905_12950 [Acerihabitans sp. KWT182]|uniref:Uncharacterized protein n=1 Tax=Acerihabitans sp. KWT182 TaxID=3157919 RepID=A0AAU7QGF3_9GAMM
MARPVAADMMAAQGHHPIALRGKGAMNNDRITDPRVGLAKLSVTLRTLHKTLIDVETHRFGPVGSPYEHLQLLTVHPQFAWLRRLSAIIAEVDERLDDKEEIDTAAMAAFKTVIQRLLSPGSENDADFYDKYTDALQASTEAAVAHGELRRLLSLLPVPAD